MKTKSVRSVVSLTLFVAMVAACSSSGSTGGVLGGSPGGTSGGSPGGVKPTPGTLISGPADPIPLTVATDDTTAATAIITPDGGTLSAKGTDGTSYTLTVPKDALAYSTAITMTPLTSVKGIPWDDAPVGVQFSPDGLQFDGVATLVITPATPVPADHQIAFSYHESDHALLLADVDPKATDLTITLQHFSGYGLSKGLLADIEPERKRLGGTDEDRINSQFAEYLQGEHQRQLLGSQGENSEFAAKFEQYSKEYIDKVLNPRILAAGESCAAGRLAIQTALGLERQRQLLGIADNGGLLKFVPLFETADLKCMQEEYEVCRDQHIIHRMVPMWLGIRRQHQLMGIPDPHGIEEEALALVKKCLSFRVEFSSTATFGGPDAGGQVTSTVNAKVKLTFNPMDITGTSALVNTAFDMTIDGCSVSPQRGGGTMEVTGLGYEVEFDSAKDANGNRKDQLGHLKDLTLVYFPGITSESAKLNCAGVSVPWPTAPLWTASFVVTHADELYQADGEAKPPTINPADIVGGILGGLGSVDLAAFGNKGPGYSAKNWDIFNKEYFAKKEWTKQVAPDVVEVGSLKLYHTPG